MSEPAVRFPGELPRSTPDAGAHFFPPAENTESDALLPTLGIAATVVFLGSSRPCDLETTQRGVREAEIRLLQSPWDDAARRGPSVARRARRNARYYEQARRLAKLVSTRTFGELRSRLVVVTGGGAGIMEAANRGAHEAGAKSVGLTVALPNDSGPNPYVTPELTLRFRDLAARKRHLFERATAIVVFPGGFGTLDELFEALTLMQTGGMARVPVLLFGKEYWSRLIRFPLLADEGVIDPEDLELFQYVDSADEAWEAIAQFARSRDFGEKRAAGAGHRNTGRLRDVSSERPGRAALGG